jgi:hypothetical protein
LRRLDRLLPDDDADEFRDLARRALDSARRGESLQQFAMSIGSRKGISGYCYHTVPCVLQAWFRFGDDLVRGLPAVIAAGGDTDTAGAIFGAIVGARVGREGIPGEWLDGIVEWPRTITWLERLGEASARSLESTSAPVPVPKYFWPGILLRNLLFLVVVLGHGLRRLLPPY